MNESIRDKIERVLDERFENEQTKATILRMIPITEVAAVDDEKLRQNVEMLLDTDNVIRFVIAEMEDSRFVTRSTVKFGVPVAETAASEPEPSPYIKRRTTKLGR